ncbi:hypothetical protein COCOBI_07-6820 [Coccomyxa sp. Obi]|nr:hypothetical protein COCOBI_07-6820 [Coccomyxa sp. Obi]
MHDPFGCLGHVRLGFLRANGVIIGIVLAVATDWEVTDGAHGSCGSHNNRAPAKYHATPQEKEVFRLVHESVVWTLENDEDFCLYDVAQIEALRLLYPAEGTCNEYYGVFLDYVLKIHIELEKECGCGRDALTVCLTTFNVKQNSENYRDMLERVLLLMLPEVRMQTLAKVARIIHEGLVHHVGNGQRAPQRGSAVPSDLSEEEQQLLYYQAGWLLGAIKFPELYRAGMASSAPDREDPEIVAACNCLISDKPVAIMDMPAHTSFAAEFDRGNLIYAGPAFKSFVESMELECRRYSDPSSFSAFSCQEMQKTFTKEVNYTSKVQKDAALRTVVRYGGYDGNKKAKNRNRLNKPY